MINFNLSEELLSLIQGAYSENLVTRVENIELIFDYFKNNQATDDEIYYLKMSSPNSMENLLRYLPSSISKELAKIIVTLISNSDYDPYAEESNGDDDYDYYSSDESNGDDDYDLSGDYLDIDALSEA